MSARTRVVRIAPDGTAAPPLQGDALIHPAAFPTLQLFRSIDAGAAIQLGCFEVLAALQFFTVDLEALVAGQPVLEGHDARQMKFERLILDWANPDEPIDPMPTCTIQITGPRVYDAANLTIAYIEGTEGICGANTVLRKVSHLTCTLQLISWFANKDDRAGCAKVLEDNLLGAVEDERSGRHVAVKVYFDRVARFILSSIEYPDIADQAHANTWELQAKLAADIDVVQLVKLPADHLPRTTVEASPSIDP